MSKFYNYEMCRLCGGKCCQNSAGIYSPEDFGVEINFDFIELLLRKGMCAVDWWNTETGKKIFFIRPRHRFEKEIAGKKDSDTKGVCVNWNSATGCTLTELQRPFQCKKLVPNYFIETDLALCLIPDESKADKESMALRWMPYQKELKQAVKLFSK